MLLLPVPGADFEVIGPRSEGGLSWVAVVKFPWTDRDPTRTPVDTVVVRGLTRARCRRKVERAKADWMERNGNPQLPWAPAPSTPDPPIGGLRPAGRTR